MFLPLMQLLRNQSSIELQTYLTDQLAPETGKARYLCPQEPVHLN